MKCKRPCENKDKYTLCTVGDEDFHKNCPKFRPDCQWFVGLGRECGKLPGTDCLEEKCEELAKGLCACGCGNTPAEGESLCAEFFEKDKKNQLAWGK